MLASRSERLLVALLLDLPPGDRKAHLLRLCAANPAWRERLADIEAALATAEEHSPAPVAARLDPPALRRAMEAVLIGSRGEGAGDFAGPYKLLQKIGEGGFGVVWMAEQQEPIRRRVAVKILKLGMDTAEVVARFEAERQALALMNHPNIAQVYGAGVTDAGRPYVAMELVRGIALTKFCDDGRLSAEARLGLFIAVCHGVQHAHQKGVIHRDLKPSNILVTLHDGVPVPKIIDFGIAKATAGVRLTDKTLFTQFHAFVGTPVYTSPEQMEMSGLDVDTRSDIYSLGVLLYELLAGRPPFDPDALVRSGLDAMRRTIREQEPRWPSACVATLSAPDRTDVARRRSEEPSQLVASLRGDLDWIVMRCLEKDRSRRYDSVSALAADVQRHLRYEPLEAHAPSRAYRVRKFVRRHRFGVAAVGAVFFSLLAGLVVASVLLAREQLALARATASERAETSLRAQADRAREAETIRASRTARDLGEQHLARGRSAEGLAWLVHAARKNPRDMTIAPRIASALTSRTFLLPIGDPLRLPSRVTNVRYFDDDRKIGAYAADGTIAVLDATTGVADVAKLPSPVASIGVLFIRGYAVVPGADRVVRIVNPASLRVEHEFSFAGRISRISVRGENAPGLFVVLEDGTFIVVDIDSGRSRTLPLRILPTMGAALSDDGRWLAVADIRTGLADLWDTNTGERCGGSMPLRTFQSVAFSRDSRRFVSAGLLGDRPVFAVHSIPDRSAIVPLTPLPGEFGSTAQFVITFSPDGRVFCIASPNGYQLFTLATGRPVGGFCASGILGTGATTDLLRKFRGVEGVENAFRGILFRDGPDGLQTIAPSNLDAVVTLTLRDATSGVPVRAPFAYAGGLGSARLSADGDTLLTIGGGGVILLWDLRTGLPRAEPHAQPGWPDGDIAMSKDGRDIVTGAPDGTVRRLRVGPAPARSLVLPRTQPLFPIAFFPGLPPRLFWPGEDRGLLIDVGAGAVLKTIDFPTRVLGTTGVQLGMTIRPDLRFVAVQTRVAGDWQIWTLENAAVTRVTLLDGAPKSQGGAVFSPTTDDVAIVSNSPVPSVATWDAVTGRARGKPILPESPMTIGYFLHPVCFSHDARLLLIGRRNGGADVCDRATGAKLVELPCDRDGITRYVDASADGARYLTSNFWGETWLWDAATGRRIGSAIPGVMARFSDSGEELITVGPGSSGARVWNGRTGAPVSAPMVHSGVGIRAVAFSADARRVATAAQDSTARIWDAATGQPVSEPLVHDSRVVNCRFSSDGRFIWTEQALSRPPLIGPFRVWSVPPDPRGQPGPEWLLQLATCLARKTIDAGDLCIDVPDAMDQIEAVRRVVAALPDDAPFVSWGRWILDDRADRPIAPGFTVTAAGADALAAQLSP